MESGQAPCADDVPDVGEIPGDIEVSDHQSGLAKAALDLGQLPGETRGDEVIRTPGPRVVEQPQPDGFQPEPRPVLKRLEILRRLGDGIGRQRTQRGAFRDRPSIVPVTTVDFRRRGDDDPSRFFEGTCRLEQVKLTEDIRPVSRLGILP